MKLDKIEALLQKYYEGETTVAEERELQAFFNEADVLPDHLKPHAAPFRYYAKQQEEEMTLSDDWLFDKIEKEKPKGKQIFFPMMQELAVYWRVAAGILLLVGAFWAGSQYRQRQTTESNAEIAALRNEVLEMKRVLATGTSASERIQLVSQEFDSEQRDEVIEVLITTINQDPNVNVRVAAAEALFRFHQKKEVRHALVESLKVQTDPLMQLTLINMLVSIKEKEAINELVELSQRKDLLPIVKDKAAEGLGILI